MLIYITFESVSWQEVKMLDMMNETPFRRYAPFWTKYRPAVLHMMQAALNDLQQYQFMKHELSSIEKKPKGG